ncbi:hypothetical protein Igag_1825 [Ignisphaera aggregans DSM 17230]|uniref:Uncharacterized protein n=1 Tax=Ignisphaera aggregans (strain DSM 17230 / JCM 13409 / AQ1.S1) TaxID=583356 RepID=E0SSN7_IGNAA|nr:hypothetical protein Igag_1825 [Ignisphaera aggregans DSM 17230]
MVKIERMTIPKSEDDLRELTERISREMSEASEEEQHASEGEVESSGIIQGEIAHQLTHIQELLIHVIQSVREVRDSIDNLSITLRKNLRTLAYIWLLNSIDSEEIKKDLLDAIAKELGLDIKKKDKR